MYIGPWQEYELFLKSRKKRSRECKNSIATTTTDKIHRRKHASNSNGSIEEFRKEPKAVLQLNENINEPSFFCKSDENYSTKFLIPKHQKTEISQQLSNTKYRISTKSIEVENDVNNMNEPSSSYKSDESYSPKFLITKSHQTVASEQLNDSENRIPAKSIDVENNVNMLLEWTENLDLLNHY